MITCCKCVLVVLAVVLVVTAGATPTTDSPHQSDTNGQLVPFPLQAVATSLGQIASSLQKLQETMENIDQKMGNIDYKMGNIDHKMGNIDHKIGNIDRKMGNIDQKMGKMQTTRMSRPIPGRIMEEGEARRPRHCQDLLNEGDSGQGVRQVYPFPGRPHDAVDVYCDQVTDGGGWLVFQRRVNLTTREDFYRTWTEYELGFGNLTGEFWRGLRLLNILSSSSLQQLRVDLSDWEGEHRWAKYGVFMVGPAEDYYRLTIDRYNGDAGESMFYHHNGNRFSTHDSDHDIDSGGNCAETFKGGWWYGHCHQANPNGLPHQGDHDSYADGIHWFQWKGHHYSLRSTTLMMKPALLK